MNPPTHLEGSESTWSCGMVSESAMLGYQETRYVDKKDNIQLLDSTRERLDLERSEIC